MPENKAVKTFTVENAVIIYRNFSGKATMYNREGDRNFHAVLDEDVAQKMLADGWNVRFKEPRDEEDDGFWHIQVAVSFKNRPPRITMIGETSQKRTVLNESVVEILDIVELTVVDFIARGYDWEANGKSGTKAYLQTMFATIYEDALDVKYSTSAADTYVGDDED